MKKIFLLLVLMLAVCTFFVTAMQTIPITQDVSVDFRGERDFRILMANGFERHFFWGENETHSDVTFSHTLYYQLDENKWCSDNSELDEYKNISTGMVSLLNVCGNVINTLNSSGDWQKKVSEAEKDREIYESEARIYREKWEDEKNQSITYKNDMNQYKEDWQTCTNKLTSCERTTGQVQTLEHDMQEALSTKNTFGFFGFVGGIIVGYFLWKKQKKGSGPSEQMEVGQETDATSSTEFGKAPPGFDGPRN